MGNAFVIIREGIFASLTGGWVYEPQQESFCNAIHLYLWLFLLCYPLVLFWTVSFTPFIWIAYCCSVAVIFVVIKLFNYRLHLMFDSKDTKTIILPEPVSSNPPSDEIEKNGNKASLEDMSQNMIETSEGIEMATIATSNQWVASPSMTPPVLCSSRMSISDSSGSGRKLKKQDGTQDIASKVLAETSDLKINNDSEWKICSTDAILSHHQGERTKNRSMGKVGCVLGSRLRETLPSRNAMCGYSIFNFDGSDLQVSNQNAGNSPHVSRLVRVKRLPGSAMAMLDLDTLLLEKWSPIEKGDSCEASLNKMLRMKVDNLKFLSQYPPPSRSSIAFKGRHHKHRRAVKRARSTMDHHMFSESDEVEKHSRRYDLNDKTSFSENVVSAVDVCSNGHGGSKDSFKDSSKFNTISSYSADHELSTEVSEPSKAFAWQDKKRSPEDAFSLSSYKETSPEMEFFPHPSGAKPRKTSFAASSFVPDNYPSSRCHRRVSIDLNNKLASFHDTKSCESSSPESSPFFQKNEEHFPDKIQMLEEKKFQLMSPSQTGTGARLKDSFYINLSESGEDLPENVLNFNKLSVLSEKPIKSAETPLQKDAMCQTQPQFCKQKSSSYKKSCIFALDDAELKKRQLQQQRLSTSAHPELSNYHQHRLASMLYRSSSYSRHKASKDVVTNAAGNSRAVDRLKGSNISFRCFPKDREKMLCPSSSMTTMIRKRCAEDDGVAQRLAHHSCATIEGPSSWFVNSDSDTHSSDEKSISFEARMSSDSLSSPTYDDDLDLSSFKCTKPRQAVGTRQPPAHKKLADKKNGKSKSESPMSKVEASRSKELDDDCLWYDIPGDETDDKEMQLVEDFRNQINLLFSSNALAKDSPRFGSDLRRRLSCSCSKRRDGRDLEYKMDEMQEDRNVSEDVDGETRTLLEASGDCLGAVGGTEEWMEIETPRKTPDRYAQQAKQNVVVSFKGGTLTDENKKSIGSGKDEVVTDQSTNSSSQSSYHSNFCHDGKHSGADDKLEEDSTNDNTTLETKNDLTTSRDDTMASKLSELQEFIDINSESADRAQDRRSGMVKIPTNAEGCSVDLNDDFLSPFPSIAQSLDQRFSGALLSHPPPPPPQIPQWTPSRLEIMVNHFFEVTQTRRTHSSNARLPTIGDSSQLSEAQPSLNEDLDQDIGSASSATQCRFGFRKHGSSMEKKQPKKIFLLQLFPWMSFKIKFDRQALQAIFDRNSKLEMFFSVFLAVLVSLFCCLLLSFEIFRDFEFWLCFIVAGSQYSLLKSVQPDSASPIHGHNWIVVFSRPLYFCLCAFLITILHYLPCHDHSFTFYGATVNPASVVSSLQEALWFFLMFLPVIFVLGLLPQVNTFLLYLLEQIEIHIFGGTAVLNLVGGMFSFVRSSLCIAFLCGLCLAFLKESPKSALQANSTQHILFSMYCGILVAMSYHFSRYSSDPHILFQMIRRSVQRRNLNKKLSNDDIDVIDPLPEQLEQSVTDRLHSDLIVCPLTATFVFAVCVSTAFSSPVLQPPLFDLLVYITASLGFIIHWLIPQLRTETPWMCLSHPIFKSFERQLFEAKAPSKVMWFEKMHLWLAILERNIFLPATFLSALTVSAREVIETNKFGNSHLACFILSVCSLKMFRCSFVNPGSQYYVIIFSRLLFQFDFKNSSETFIVDYFFISIVLHKVKELMLKLKFILMYIAPWQINWGSAFHAFAQPFSIPHSAFLFLQALISSILSAPLNPLLGSTIFLTSYVRPVKFWEKDYNTKRVDHTNTRLVAQIDRSVKFDDDNLNSIFYEHLTRSLQKSLCGDLALGRWGVVNQGDCFVMASDYLNALVHLVEMGNGFATFQLRGLEFRGTYCQQREVEAITEDLDGNRGFCCCKPGHLPHFLSVNASFNQRWLAWQVVSAKFVAEGYSVSDNSAASMLQVYDLRKMLITFYVKSIIYYAVRSPKLYQWLCHKAMKEALTSMNSRDYVDVDPTFAASVDADYDMRRQGVSRMSFCDSYHDWIQYCASRRDKTLDASNNSFLVTLCFALSLLGRRSLGTESHNNASANVEFFLYGLHALFKGDIRINSVRDEWVFADMELLRRVIAPGIRMSLKLHQDHFASPDEYDKNSSLYGAITAHESNMMISHEGDPAWRNAVLSNVPSLLALRHVLDEGTNEYKVIMLTKRYLTFRVIKVNSECVRGFWAGQLQELIFLRNNNSERGSIQNAKQSLRNIVNSSCDQPIGYPIYVSPLTTSYLASNSQYSQVAGKEISFWAIFSALRNAWTRMKTRCSSSCMSGRSMSAMEEQNSARNAPNNPVMLRSTRPLLGSNTDQSNPAFINRGSVISSTSSASKPSLALPNLVGFVAEQQQYLQHEKLQQLQQHAAKDVTTQRVMITDPSKMFDNINLGRPIDVQWPNEEWRNAGGKSGWDGWVPEKGMEGVLVHRWTPCHREPSKRSHVDKTILLVKIGDRYVPLTEAGVTYLGTDNSQAFVETIST